MLEVHVPSSSQTDARRSLGRKGEDMAVDALRHVDLQVIDRNWRCTVGEIDIIAQEQAPDFSQGGLMATWLVIVEVRTRRGYSHGSAKDAVDRRKQSKLRQVATTYVQETGWQG